MAENKSINCQRLDVGKGMTEREQHKRAFGVTMEVSCIHMSCILTAVMVIHAVKL